MRYLELYEEQQHGTFVGLKLTPQTINKITEWYKKNDIEDPNYDLHVTLIFDKTAKFSWDPKSYKPALKIPAKSGSFDLYGPSNNTLVYKFKNDTLEKRHNGAREMYDLDWDYPEYSPHVTLAYSIPAGFDIKELSPIDFDIEIYKEYVEPFAVLTENISIPGTEKAQLMRKNNIKPGTEEWFKLWFSRPHLTGEQFKSDPK